MVDQRFALGYCTFLGSILIISAHLEAESGGKIQCRGRFCYMGHGICKVLWMKGILEEMKLLTEEVSNFTVITNRQ